MNGYIKHRIEWTRKTTKGDPMGTERNVLVGTEGGLRRLRDGGWTEELMGRSVTGLASDDTGTWWALLDGRTLWRRDEEDWLETAAVNGFRANCLLPRGDAVLVGTSQARLLVVGPDGTKPLDGFDRVEGRDSWYTPWGGPPDSRSMARDEARGLYVNVHVGGIPRSRDDGATWEPTIDIDTDVHQVTAGEGVVLAATAQGLALSDDGGDTWRFEAAGLHAAYCRAVALSEGTVLLTASRSHRGQQAGIYRAPLGDLAFERCIEGLPDWFDDNIDTHCLAASGRDVAFGTSDGTVFASADLGETWEVVGNGLPPVRCVALG
jgi:hypothetical protein